MFLLPFTFVFSSCYLLVSAGSQTHGQNCTVLHNRLEAGTYQFHSDCDAQTYCSAQGICMPKGCRRDQYPFGYAQSSDLPPMCPTGQFCPDEGDACQPLLSVGSPCQLNRDDQCEPPPNWGEFTDSRFGNNVNGAVCLNDFCMWANVTVGQPCQVENTAYIVFAGASDFIDIISRGNCLVGSYCDSQQLVCIQGKSLGESCGADKECASSNCDGGGICVRSSDLPNEFSTWVYILAGGCIIGGIFATLFALSWIHQRQREAERKKRLQYWHEQHTFRQEIHQMQESARTSILSLANGNSVRNTVHSYAGSEDLSRPMLQHTVTKSSGLRHYIVEDESVSDQGSALQSK